LKGEDFMQRKVLAIILCVIIIGIVIIGFVMYYSSNQNTEVLNNNKNADNKEVKDVGNIEEDFEGDYFGGDTFAKVGDFVAYINRYDNNSLNIVDIKNRTHKKIETFQNGFEKIYFDGENIYGLMGHYMGKGIYKVNLQGNMTKIYDGECVQLLVKDDVIYFVRQEGFDEINQTPQGDLCKMNKDGQNIGTVIENVKNYFYIHNEKIYYIDWASRAIYRANIDGKDKTLLANGRCYITAVTDNFITYIDFADGEKHRILYFDGNVNHAIGRFGNDYISDNNYYIYTRKLIGNNNDIEDDFTMYKINDNEKTETEIWKNSDMTHLTHIYNGYAYFYGNGICKIKLNSKEATKEQTNLTSANFVGKYCYGTRWKDGELHEFVITNLDTLNEIKIPIK